MNDHIYYFRIFCLANKPKNKENEKYKEIIKQMVLLYISAAM